MSEFNVLVPLVTNAWVAQELLGVGHVRLYRMLQDGDLKILPGKGVTRILMSSIENALGGHRITAEEYAAAVSRANESRNKALAYQSDYRAKKTALEQKKAARHGAAATV